MVKRHQKQTAQQEGGIISKELSDPPVQRRDRRSEGRQADARRIQDHWRGRRIARRCACRQAFGSRDRWLRNPKTAKPKSRRRRSTSRRRPRPAPRRPQAAKDKAAAKKEAEAGEKKPREPEERVTPRLRTQFDEVIRKALTEQFGYKNPMQVPRVDKIVLNMGIGEGVADRKKVEQAAEATDRDRRPEGRSSPSRASRSRPTSCATARRSAARSRCARRACTSSSTAW